MFFFSSFESKTFDFSNL